MTYPPLEFLTSTLTAGAAAVVKADRLELVDGPAAAAPPAPRLGELVDVARLGLTIRRPRQ